MNNLHRFPIHWKLNPHETAYPADGIIEHNKTVFTTFSCGGGSSMGYKLAGYNVIAANDIDPQMKRVYLANHRPNWYVLAPVKDLLHIDLPKELFDLDVLDGSPPCSTFSMVGLREKAWGKEKHFKEGQASQVLDDLFFDFIKLAKRLQPKTVIAENVKGMLQGHAKGYLVEIFKQFELAGYNTQLFLLNSSTMGVPQKRERVFFVCSRKDLALPKIHMEFDETPITFGEIYTDYTDKTLSERMHKVWLRRRRGDVDFSTIMGRVVNKPNSYYNHNLIYKHQVCNTIPANNVNVLFDESRYMNKTETILASTFPLDYNFLDLEVDYLCGMSVPPVMMAQVASEVYFQWLSKL